MRETGSPDRRTQRISLTDQGKTKLEQLRKMHMQSIQELLKPYSEQELVMFRDLHKKITGFIFTGK